MYVKCFYFLFNINDLIDLATSKKDIYFRDRAILEIIRLLSRKNDLGEEVYDLVDQINDEFWSSKAYYYIILSLLKTSIFSSRRFI